MRSTGKVRLYRGRKTFINVEDNKKSERLVVGVTYTTVNIDDLKRVKREALERGITLRELVNLAIKEYLERHPRKGGED